VYDFGMVVIYRRHRKTCPYTSRAERRCRCPLYAEGTIGNERIRESLNLTSWEAAQRTLRAWESAGTFRQKADVTLEEALEKFIADCETRNLKPVTLGKYKLVARTLKTFAEQHSLRLLTDIDPGALRDFRATWTLGPRTAANWIEKLRSFFKFCVENEWCSRNPARLLRRPIIRENHVEPFSPDEQQKILETAYRLSTGAEKGKHGALPPNPLTGTFAKLLLHTGLRITDAAMLHRDRLSEGRLFLYATKNGKPVSLPLPPDLLAELAGVKTMCFFQTPGGSERGETVSDYWRDQLRKIFAAASIRHGKPHRFRHSLVMNMLNNGSSIEDCALVIGDSPAIVAKHYSEYVQSRQDRVDVQIQKTWAQIPMKLVRVK
jgi:integrase